MAVLALVALLSLFAVIRLVSVRSGPGATAVPSTAESAPLSSTGPPIAGGGRAVVVGPATSVRVPTDGCESAGTLELHGLDSALHAVSQSGDPLADLEVSGCGTGGAVVVSPDGDALLSPSGIAADADYTACAEAMREGTVTSLRVGAGATFCALQRADTVPYFSGQTSARLTVTGVDAGGVTVEVVRWRV